MLISICDDNLLHSSRIEKIILEHFKKFMNLSVEVNIFHSAEPLLKSLQISESSCQILFLDIEMEGMNGIEAAHNIRKFDTEIIIIYITSYDKYTLESFEVKPFRFLIKPVTKSQLTHVLSQAIYDIMNSNQYLFYKQQNTQCQIKCSKIISITSEKGRILRICTTNSDEDILFYRKIKEIQEQLNPLQFVKVNQGTIINLHHINIITRNEVHMINGQVIPISRGQKKIVKDTYSDFISQKLGLNL